MALIGATILNGTTRRVSDVSIDAMSAPPHRAIWASCLEMGQGIDLVTLKQHLQDRDQLTFIGGEDYLIQCCEECGSVQNAEEYAQIVISKYHRRLIHESADELRDLAGDPEAEDSAAIGALAGLQRRITQAQGSRLLRLEEISDEDTAGVASTFDDINENTESGGYPVGQTSIIAAYTGSGKTAWMVGEAFDMALRGVDVLYATFADLDARGVRKRGIRSLTGRTDTSGMDLLEREEWEYIVSEAGRHMTIYQSSLHGRTVESLEAAVMRWRDSHVGREAIVFVDYIQKVGLAARHDGLLHRMTEVSASLKRIAEDAELPVVVGCQITREAKGRDNAEGTRAWGTKYAQAIEEDAGLLIGITTDWKEEPPIPAIMLYKNRFGPSLTAIEAAWDRPRARYVPG